MNYAIEYSPTFGQYIKIKAQIQVNEQDKTILTFPSWRPGRYEMGNFAKNVKNFGVFDQNQKKVSFHKISSNQWEVETKTTSEIEVVYFYYASELNAGSTYVDDQQLYVNLVNCLVYEAEQQNNPCQLKLIIPNHYKIACGIPFEDKVLHTKTYHELVDSPFIASATLQHNTYQVKGVKFHLWFQGHVQIEWDKVIEDFVKFTRFQMQMFGHFPVSEYHFLFQILPIKAYHGVEHQNSTVIALGPTYDLMSSLYDDFLGVSSHELYHTWNIKAIRPKEMYPYDYRIENNSKLGYVAEGVTTYLGDLFLSLSEVKSWPWYKTEIEKLLQKHFDNFGRFNYAVANSSYDTWLDGYVAGAPHRKVSIYNEGALIALILDICIRKNTNNKASIHEVMRRLYVDFAQKGKGYTDEDYINLVSEVANEDLSDFFKQYVYNANALESILTKTIEDFGFELKMELNPNFTERILGMKTQTSNRKTLVVITYPGSSADMGNLLVDDEIISINGFQVNGDLHKWVEYFQDNQIVLTISRKGRIIELVCPNTNRNYYPKYKLVKPNTTSNPSKSLFRKWCGYKWQEV
ncbi:MAG: M61 family metallopeptidase [Putridiphycobacter sp.]